MTKASATPKQMFWCTIGICLLLGGLYILPYYKPEKDNIPAHAPTRAPAPIQTRDPLDQWV